MSLYVDIALPGFTASNVQLQVINVSSTSSRAYYSVDFFDNDERVRVPVERYFTFGEPRNVGLLRYAASQGVRVHVRDDAASMHQQCYDDLRHRFALGLLPWVTAMRDGDEEIERVEPPQMVAPEPEPVAIETPEPDPAYPPSPEVPEPNDPVTDALVPDQDEGVAVLPPVDVELSAIDDVEAARAIIMQRLHAIALAKAGVNIVGFQRLSQLAIIQTDADSTPEEKRDAELEAAQFAERAAGGSPYELARQLKAARVATLVTIEQLRAYDVFEGWPT